MSHRMKLRGGISVLALTVVAAGACGDPAGVSIDVGATGAAYDGGHTFGSGNGVASDPQTATAQSDTTQRGGVLIGSGH